MPTTEQREIAALTREGEQYLAAGMLERAELVNEQLRLRGADPVALPKAPSPPKQARSSTQATTRRKAAE